MSGWWFGTFFLFSNSWYDDPIWLSYFSGVLKPPIRCGFSLTPNFNGRVGFDPSLFAHWDVSCVWLQLEFDTGLRTHRYEKRICFNSWDGRKLLPVLRKSQLAVKKVRLWGPFPLIGKLVRHHHLQWNWPSHHWLLREQPMSPGVGAGCRTAACENWWCFMEAQVFQLHWGGMVGKWFTLWQEFVYMYIYDIIYVYIVIYSFIYICIYLLHIYIVCIYGSGIDGQFCSIHKIVIFDSYVSYVKWPVTGMMDIINDG